METNKKYEPIEELEPGIVSASLGTYNTGCEQIVLSIPKNMDADIIREKVDVFYSQLLAELNDEQKFYRLFKEWWEKTCLYSGPGLCYKNDEFCKIHQMGAKTLRWIDELKKTAPDYMGRHIEWLKRGVLQ